jgi:hypothetical protein
VTGSAARAKIYFGAFCSLSADIKLSRTPELSVSDLSEKSPKYTLEEYRKFIREAAPYISLVAGRKIKPAEAESMSDDELTKLALIIDERVSALKKNLPFGGN